MVAYFIELSCSIHVGILVRELSARKKTLPSFLMALMRMLRAPKTRDGLSFNCDVIREHAKRRTKRAKLRAILE